MRLRFAPILIFLFMLIVYPTSFASAHMSSDRESVSLDDPGTNMMMFEDQVLSDDELHEQMEEYMLKMMNGTLNEDEFDQLQEWMKSNDYQPAMMSLMMRSLIADEWQYDQWRTVGNWVTMILVWVFLILGILTFWKFLNKK